MPQIVDIPGVAELEFPDNMPREEVQQRSQEFAQQRGLNQPPRVSDPVSSGQAFGRGALTGFLDSFLDIPEQVANLSIQGRQQLGPVTESIPGATIASGLQQRLTEGQLPESEQADLPLPTSEDVFAGGRMLGELGAAVRTGDFGQFTPNPREAEQEQTLQARQEHPGLFNLGEALGMGGALATGRAPIARASQGSPSVGRSVLGQGERGLSRARTRSLGRGRQPRSSLRTLEDLAGAETTKKIADFVGRSGEAGVEGLTLSLIQDGDPLETAAYAAGGQATGSILQEGVQGLFSGGPLKAGGKIGATALAAGSLFQLGKEAVPGGKDFILESIETGFGKVLGGIALGALGSAVGSGRATGKMAERFPAFMDSLTSVRRGAVISALDDFMSSDTANQRNMEAVTNKLIEDPAFFNDTERRRIGRALTVDKVSLSDTINRLSENRGFRSKLGELTQDMPNPEEAQSPPSRASDGSLQ